MATRPAASRFLVLLFVLFLLLLFLIFIQFGSAADENQGTELRRPAQGTNEHMMRIQQRTQTTGATNITAEPGQNVTLACRAAENKPVIVFDWSKPDLGENGHVALYRDDRLNYRELNPAYKNRVDLQDKEMKNGNVSLVLRKVTFNDTGKYECRVVQREVRRRKRSHLDTEPICIITLHVSAPGNEGGQKDGGNKEGQKQDRGDVEGQPEDGGTSTGLTVGLPVGLLLLALLAVSGFLLYKKPRRSPQEQKQPPAAEAELQAMNVENHQEPEM